MARSYTGIIGSRLNLKWNHPPIKSAT